jgi:hypothetical protein
MLAKGAVQLFLCLGRYAQAAHGPDHHPVAHLGKLVSSEERRLAELRHIGEQRHAGQAASELAEHALIVQCLREDRIRTRLDIELRAGNRSFEPLAGGGIGSGDDVEMASRLGAGGNFGCHVMGCGQLLVIQVAALLGQLLVLDMDRAGASILEGAHHVHGI